MRTVAAMILISAVICFFLSCLIHSHRKERLDMEAFIERIEENERVFKKLKHVAKSKKVSVYYGNRGYSYYMPVLGNKHITGKIELDVNCRNPVFTLAHELGHAMSTRSADYDRLLEGIKLMKTKEEFYKQYKTLPPYTKLVVIEEEVIATKIGCKLLEQVGHKYTEEYRKDFLSRIGNLVYVLNNP